MSEITAKQPRRDVRSVVEPGTKTLSGSDTSFRTEGARPITFPKPSAQLGPRPPDDNQDDAQQPCPPQHLFSLYVSWLVKRYSEPHIPETREIRRFAHDIDKNGHPSPLQLYRNATTTSSNWHIDNHRRREMSVWCYRRAMVWSCY